MTKAKNIILTAVVTVCMVGLTAGVSHSGSGAHGKQQTGKSYKSSQKRSVKQSQTETRSTTGSGAGGMTETGIPPGFGTRETIRSDFTVEKVEAEASGTGAGGSTGSGSDRTLQRGTGGTTGDSGAQRSTGGTPEQESGQTIDQSSGGTDDQGTGWMRNRGPGGTLGETGETRDSINSSGGDTNIGSEGRSEPRSGDSTGGDSPANPEVPR